VLSLSLGADGADGPLLIGDALLTAADAPARPLANKMENSW